MKSIKRLYLHIKETKPRWADFPCLAKSVAHKGYKRPLILKYFNELIPQGDYLNSEKRELMDYLVNISGTKNSAEECIE